MNHSKTARDARAIYNFTNERCEARRTMSLAQLDKSMKEEWAGYKLYYEMFTLKKEVTNEPN